MRGLDFHAKVQAARETLTARPHFFSLYLERIAFYEIRLANAHHQTLPPTSGWQAGYSLDPPQGRISGANRGRGRHAT
jgi:hypothetical protein